MYLKYFLKLSHGNSAVDQGDLVNTGTHLVDRKVNYVASVSIEFYWKEIGIGVTVGRKELASWSKSWQGWGSSSLVSLRWEGRSTGSTGWNLQMSNSQWERESLRQRLESRLHSFQVWQTWDALAKSRGSSTCPNISRITFVFNQLLTPFLILSLFTFLSLSLSLFASFDSLFSFHLSIFSYSCFSFTFFLFLYFPSFLFCLVFLLCSFPFFLSLIQKQGDDRNMMTFSK